MWFRRFLARFLRVLDLGQPSLLLTGNDYSNNGLILVFPNCPRNCQLKKDLMVMIIKYFTYLSWTTYRKVKNPSLDFNKDGPDHLLCS